VQYLPVVIGPVMKAASLKPEVTVLDNEDMEGLAGDENWQFVSLSEQQNFGLRTSGTSFFLKWITSLIEF